MTLPLTPVHPGLSNHARINSLDGLRGLAILLVLLFHTYSRWPDFMPWATVHKDFFLFKFGHLGVELFFLISGFVIYMTLEKCRSFSEFMYRRWLRLFPAMLIGTALVYLSSYYLIERPNGEATLLNTLPGLLFIDHQIMNALQNITDFIPVEGAFWSLFVEVKFYLLFGALYFHNKATALRNLIMIFLCAFAYVVALVCASVFMMIPTIMIKYDPEASVLIACTLVYLTFYLALNTSVVSSIFASRLFAFFGFISYPLYLIHENAMVAMTIKTYHFAPQLPELLTPWPGIILIVLVSYLIAKYLEPAMRDTLKKRLNVLNQTIKKEASKRGFIRPAA